MSSDAPGRRNLRRTSTTEPYVYQDGPLFQERTGDKNPFAGIDVGNHAAPDCTDFDGDGDMDCVVGDALGTLKYYVNLGNAPVPGTAGVPRFRRENRR